MWNEPAYLRALRRAGLTHTEVARRLGISYRTLCRWRAGIHRPSRADLLALASVLGVADSDHREKK